MGVSLAELEVLINLQTIGEGQINSLKGSLLGLGTGAGLAAVGIGGLYMIGKSALDNYEKQESAAKNLTQAFKTQGQAVPTAQIQAWLDKNKAFISDQYDAEQAIAAATRAGISWKDTQLLMQDAMELSIDRGMSMSDAMDTLVKAAAGGRAQLAYLGITSTTLTADTNVLANAQKAASKADAEKAAADRALQEELVRLHDKHRITQNDLMHLADLKAKDLKATQDDKKAHGELAKAQADVNKQGDRALTLHNELAPKLKGEEQTVSKLQQDQNKLNTDWQNFSAKIGPGVQTMLDGIVQALDAAVGALGALGDDLGRIGDWLEAHSNLGDPNLHKGPAGGGRGAFKRSQYGGPAAGGQTIMVGETGPELFTPSGNGFVTPNSRMGGNITVNVSSSPGQDPSAMGRHIARAMRRQMAT